MTPIVTPNSLRADLRERIYIVYIPSNSARILPKRHYPQIVVRAGQMRAG